MAHKQNLIRDLVSANPKTNLVREVLRVRSICGVEMRANTCFVASNLAGALPRKIGITPEPRRRLRP